MIGGQNIVLLVDKHPRPSDETAVIRTNGGDTNKHEFNKWETIFVKIKLVDAGPNFDSNTTPSGIVFTVVSPGDHILKISGIQKSCDWSNCNYGSESFGMVHFNAEARKMYYLKAVWSGDTLYFWMEDSETGEVVSKERPPTSYKPERECWDSGPGEFVPCGEQGTY